MNTNAKKKAHASRVVNTAGWPSMEQMIALAIGRAELELEGVLKTRCSDLEWEDRDVDVDLAVELALGQVWKMKDMSFEDAMAFDSEWFQARAAVALSIKAFSRPESFYGRRLAKALRMFDEAASFVECAMPHPGDVKET